MQREPWRSFLHVRGRPPPGWKDHNAARTDRGSMPELWENPDFDWQMFYLLKPYSNNITNRAVKTPKLYFLDTGLAAYLTKWNTVDVLKNGAMAGAFFESFVISEIIKSYYM